MATVMGDFQVSTEVLVIGGGIVGSGVAMHLSRLGISDVRVLDFDLEGSFSSSELNAGGVRATWNQPINIELSRLSIEYFSTIAEEVGYRPCGYLWLHSAEKLKGALKARELQMAQGWPVEVWDAAEMTRKIPFLNKTDGIAGAIFAPRDGLVNPNLLKNHYRTRARASGVKFDDRTLCRSAEWNQTGIQIIAERFAQPLSQDCRKRVLESRFTEQPKEIQAEKVTYQAKRVVNCAGPWAPEVAQILGYSCPSIPVRRQISIFDCRDVDLTPHGMIVDTSGVYFHPEASNGLAGFTCKEPSGVCFEYDGEMFFNEYIWPALYERSTGFERLKHLTGWAGLYEVSPDESGIVGKVEGTKDRLFEAHSFSGHGVMQSQSAGLGLAELLAKGKYQSVDLSALSGSRFSRGALIREDMII